MRTRLGLGLLAGWMTVASCGDTDAVVGGETETMGSSSTGAGPGMPEDSASPDVTTGADGTSTGGECSLADTSVCDDDDPCTADDCFDGMCTHEPEADGTACTTASGDGGSCQSGECVSACTADRECDDRNACTTDSCDGTLGQCVFEELDGVDAPASEQSDADCQVVECQAGVAVSE